MKSNSFKSYNKVLSRFNENGFIIINLLDKKLIALFQKKILNKLKSISKKKKYHKKLAKLERIEDYHKIGLNLSEHKDLTNSSGRFLNLSKRGIDPFINKKIDSIFEYFYGNEAPIIKYPKKKKFVNNVVGFRVVRPNEKIVAKFHSESTYGIHCFTLWIPLTGYNSKYTLKIIPKSHLFRHQEKNIIFNKEFSTAKIFKKKYIDRFGPSLRPNLNPGDAIFFHPDLIHGNSKNLGNKTRVNLEMRFYRKEIKFSVSKKREIKRNNLN